MSYRTIARRLESARLAVTNALAEEEVREALARYGYDEARLLQGRAYYETALAQLQVQQQKMSNRRASSQALRRTEKVCLDSYMHSIKLARIVCRDDPATYRSLGLTGQRQTNFPGRLSQMRLFYITALNNPDILERLAGYGLGESQLQDAMAQVEAVEAMRAQRELDSGAAQDATQNHQQALSVLDRWMSDFTRIARLALADTPQRLEMLGLGSE